MTAACGRAECKCCRDCGTQDREKRQGKRERKGKEKRKDNRTTQTNHQNDRDTENGGGKEEHKEKEEKRKDKSEMCIEAIRAEAELRHEKKGEKGGTKEVMRGGETTKNGKEKGRSRNQECNKEEKETQKNEDPDHREPKQREEEKNKQAENVATKERERREEERRKNWTRLVEKRRKEKKAERKEEERKKRAELGTMEITRLATDNNSKRGDDVSNGKQARGGNEAHGCDTRNDNTITLITRLEQIINGSNGARIKKVIKETLLQEKEMKTESSPESKDTKGKDNENQKDREGNPDETNPGAQGTKDRNQTEGKTTRKKKEEQEDNEGNDKNVGNQRIKCNICEKEASEMCRGPAATPLCQACRDDYRHPRRKDQEKVEEQEPETEAGKKKGIGPKEG
jgi:hypothetical protein